MNKREYILIFVIVLFFVGAALLISVWPRKNVRHVTISLTTNSLTLATNEIVFRIENGENFSIFLSKIIVESKNSEGWRTVNQIMPSADQIVASEKFKDLALTRPAEDYPWRLRIVYGDELSGIGLFFTKLDFAVHTYRIPGKGFGAFAGSNSVSSGEIAK